MTRAALRASISEAEYQDWIRYYNAEPFGFPRREARHARQTAAIYQSSPNKMPKQAREEKTHAYAYLQPMSDEEQEEMMHAMYKKPRKLRPDA